MSLRLTLAAVAATLAFADHAGARLGLYMAYDSEDRGDTTNGWANVDYLGTVEPGTRTDLGAATHDRPADHQRARRIGGRPDRGLKPAARRGAPRPAKAAFERLFSFPWRMPACRPGCAGTGFWPAAGKGAIV